MGDLFFFNVTRSVFPKALGYELTRISGYLHAVKQSKEENFITYNW